MVPSAPLSQAYSVLSGLCEDGDRVRERDGCAFLAELDEPGLEAVLVRHRLAKGQELAGAADRDSVFQVVRGLVKLRSR